MGGHYQRHLDIPRGDHAGWKLQGRPGFHGGSLCGGRTRRVVSFILYLNRAWDHTDGGALRVYSAYDQGTPQASGPAARQRQPPVQQPPSYAATAGRMLQPPVYEEVQHASQAAEDIMPEGGTLVLLMSGDVEHMVRETHAERQCIVGWFNEYREERVYEDL